VSLPHGINARPIEQSLNSLGNAIGRLRVDEERFPTGTFDRRTPSQQPGASE